MRALIRDPSQGSLSSRELQARVREERACAAAVMSMILLALAPLPACCDQGPDSAISSPC